METLERVANVIQHAKVIGAPRSMPDYAFDYLLENALTGSWTNR
ncbi:MAG: hypothetical protein R2688_08510 [Fimbriimonadaceae bacterium]